MAEVSGPKLRVPADKLTRKKVAIVGFTDHRGQAFLLGDDFELWGINELHRVPGCEWQKFHRWFEVHPRKDIDQDAPHIETMRQMDIPVYMQQHHADIPNSVPFPRDEIMEHFGIDYFTNSIAWQVSHALLLGAEEIHIYGVDMAQDEEYATQRPCCEYWLGIARGMGVKVYVSPTSDLLKTIGQYGFGDVGTEYSQKLHERIQWLHNQDNDFLTQIRGIDAQYAKLKEQFEAEYNQKVAAVENEYRNKREGLLAQRNQVFGAILDCNFWQRSWAVHTAKDRTFSPDRSNDPRIGIAPKDADMTGVSASKRILEGAAA